MSNYLVDCLIEFTIFSKDMQESMKGHLEDINGLTEIEIPANPYFVKSVPFGEIGIFKQWLSEALEDYKEKFKQSISKQYGFSCDRLEITIVPLWVYLIGENGKKITIYSENALSVMEEQQELEEILKDDIESIQKINNISIEIKNTDKEIKELEDSIEFHNVKLNLENRENLTYLKERNEKSKHEILKLKESIENRLKRIDKCMANNIIWLVEEGITV